MSYPEKSKTGTGGDELAELLSRAVEATGAFSSTAHREPALAALRRGTRTVSRPFPSTALTEPTLRLAAAQARR